MKFKEINQKYTAKVAEYLAKGYVINTATMSGSQGELAKIDLTDGEKVVRIMLTRASGWGDWWWEGYKLVVGIATDSVKIHDFDTWSTIWNERLDIIEEETFYRVGNDSRKDWFVTSEESKAGYEKMVARYSDKEEVDKDIDLGEKGAKIVLPFVKKQYRCGRAKACDVKVVKKIRKNYGVRYYVSYKNHTWTLT